MLNNHSEAADKQTIERITMLLKKRNETARHLADCINVSTGNISEWRALRARPSLDVIIRIAEHFKVSSDYLLGLTDEPSPKSPRLNKSTLTKAEKNFIVDYRRMNETDQVRICEHIKRVARGNSIVEMVKEAWETDKVTTLDDGSITVNLAETAKRIMKKILEN